MLDFCAFSRTNLLQEQRISDATKTAIKRECDVILCDKGHVIPSFSMPDASQSLRLRKFANGKDRERV